MPKRKVVYDSLSDNGKWSVKDECAQRALKNFENKKEDVDFVRQIAKNTEFGQLKIQKQDGTFQKEYNYRKDPFPPEG